MAKLRVLDTNAMVAVAQGRLEIKGDSRRAKVLKLPDAIIAATAMALGATLLSNDSAFARVEGLDVETF